MKKKKYNFNFIFGIVLLVFTIVPMFIRKIKDIKHEIDIADIFRI